MSSELYNPLKSVSLQELETAVAKAISDLVGADYKCSISNLTFVRIFEARLELSLHKSLYLNITSPGKSQEDTP